MLQTIRDRLTGWVAIVVIAGIAVALVISFGKSRTDVSAQNFAARVNNEDISVAEFRQNYQNRLAQEQERTRTELTSAGTQQLQKQVLDQMILSRAVAQFVRDQGYRVDNNSLGESLRKIPAFQVGGKFSQTGYEATLASQGKSKGTFEEEVRTNMQIEQLLDGLLASAFYTPAEFRRFVTLEGERRAVSYAVIDPQKLMGSVQLQEADLKAYYDTHPDKFEIPESVSLDYVEASISDLGQEPQVDEAKLHAIFDADPDRFRSAEQRRSRHILIAANGDRDAPRAEQLARDIRARLGKGEDFSALAKQYSNDPGSAAAGGELGWAGRGTFVGPFEKSLFGLKIDEISEPVRTEFGYHVIQLEETRGGASRAFEEVRDQLVKEAGTRDAQDRYAGLTEKMDDAALQNPSSLDAVAKATGLPVKHLDAFTRGGGGPFGANRSVIDAVFAAAVLEEGENSPLIELGEGHTAVFRVAEHRRAKLRPFEDARSQAETELRREKASELAAARGQEILKRATGGGDLGAIAREFDVALATPQPVGRGATDLPAELLAVIFGRRSPPLELPAMAEWRSVPEGMQSIASML